MPISREAVAVQAFLATPAAKEVLGLHSTIVRVMGQPLRRSGRFLATTERDFTLEARAWLLGLAAEHGARWRDAALLAIQNCSARSRAITAHFASARAQAIVLIEAGRLAAAVDWMMAALATCPGGAPASIELLMESSGRASVRRGEQAVRRWVEAFQ